MELNAEKMLMAMETNEQALSLTEEVAKNVAAVQTQVLEKILRSNAGVEYFRKCGFDGIPTKEEFKRFPVASYMDIAPYVEKIANGNGKNLLCAAAVQEVLKSSGTSSGGRQKLFPKLRDYDTEFLILNRIAEAALNRQGPYNSGKRLSFIYVRKPEMTPSGVARSSGLSSYFTSSAFRNRKVDPASGYTSPDEVIQCFDYSQAVYCHLLCGLAQSQQVVSIGSVFASTLVRSLKALNDHWKELCADLRAGIIGNHRIIRDQTLKDAVNTILKPDPKLADFITEVFSARNRKGVIRRLWPNARLIQTIVTGTMKQYVPFIDFLSDNLPIASSIYASSECSSLGVNLEPICPPSEVLYTFFPCFAYFEFLPLQEDASVQEQEVSADQLVELADVELGKEYELVLTTNAGLYRYRVGDVVKAVKFHNAAPQFAFVQRAGVLLSVDTDKTLEAELHNAVSGASSILLENHQVHLLDYTSRVESSSQPGHYVIYWELCPSTLESRELELDKCCNELEQSLGAVYRRNRHEGTVGPLELKLLASGTFDRVSEYLVLKYRGSIAQYKTPRYVREPDVMCILETAVVAKEQAQQVIRSSL